MILQCRYSTLVQYIVVCVAAATLQMVLGVTHTTVDTEDNTSAKGAIHIYCQYNIPQAC